jgi:cytochrome bd-type quinol oxidase subunit 2
VAADWLDYRTERGRTLVYVSDICIVGVGVVLALAVGRHWSWGPFIPGPAVGVLGLSVHAALLGIVVKVFRPDVDQRNKARQGLRQRHLVVIPSYIALGLCVGLIAGALRSYWPDLALAVMVVVFGLLVPLALLPLVKRKADAVRNGE